MAQNACEVFFFLYSTNLLDFVFNEVHEVNGGSGKLWKTLLLAWVLIWFNVTRGESDLVYSSILSNFDEKQLLAVLSIFMLIRINLYFVQTFQFLRKTRRETVKFDRIFPASRPLANSLEIPVDFRFRLHPFPISRTKARQSQTPFLESRETGNWF